MTMTDDDEEITAEASHNAIFQPELNTMLNFNQDFTRYFIPGKISQDATFQPRLHMMLNFS